MTDREDPCSLGAPGSRSGPCIIVATELRVAEDLLLLKSSCGHVARFNLKTRHHYSLASSIIQSVHKARENPDGPQFVWECDKGCVTHPPTSSGRKLYTEARGGSGEPSADREPPPPTDDDVPPPLRSSPQVLPMPGISGPSKACPPRRQDGFRVPPVLPDV